MVRLLRVALHILKVQPFFQSHNGAIAAFFKKLTQQRKGKTFNPTMVRLLLATEASKRVGEMAFNPTMVRLLPVPPIQQILPNLCFQSHNGAIAAVFLQDL